MNRTRIAVALGGLTTLASVVAPSVVLGILGALAISTMLGLCLGALIARADRQLDRDERACDAAAKSRGGVPFHTQLNRTTTERHHAK